MAKLIIKLEPEFTPYNDLNLILDGKLLGSITNKQVREFEIPAGRHTFKSTVDWLSSPEIEIDLQENETKTVEIENYRGVKKLTKLYWLLFPIMLSSIYFPKFYGKFYDRQPVLGYFFLALALIPIFYLIYLLTFGRKNALRLRLL